MIPKLILLAFFTFSGCQEEPVRGVKVTQLFPVLDTAGSFLGYDTLTVHCFYSQHLEAYQIPLSQSKNGQHQTKFIYFIADKDSAYGYAYEKNSLSSKRVSKEKFLKEETWIKQVYGYHAFEENVLSLVSSKTNQETGDLEEVYTGYNKRDTAGKGSIYYTYTNRMKEIPYSLSEQLDSIKQMKLCKIRLVRHPYYFKEKHLHIKEFDGVYTLEEIPVSADHEVVGFLKQYQQDRKQP